MTDIQEIRALSGLSVQHIANWLGVSRTMVHMAEKSKRHLSSKSLFKLSSMLLQLRAQQQIAKTGRVEFSDPLKLADLHREKMEKHRKLAASLQKQLEKLQRDLPKLQSKQELFNVLKNEEIVGYKRNRGDEIALEMMEMDSKDPAVLLEELELLQDKIDTHLAYAQLHQEKWGMFVGMG